MTREFLLVGLLLLIAAAANGKCNSPALLNLVSTSGSTCSVAKVTINGNTFGGSAKMVTITDNGGGYVFPGTATSSPFTFTYYPSSGDIGKKITITVTTNDPPGKDCKPVKLTYTLTVNAIPPAPGISTITQPTCSKLTGSVVLLDLPDDGKWTVTSNPDIISFSGTGTSATVTNLQTGKYNFRVTNAAECLSAWSGDVNIQSPPFVPTVMITDPAPVCFPSTADLTASSVTAGSGTGLIYTYWRNSSATQVFNSPSAAPEGTYYIKGTAASGCSDIKPVRVTVTEKPLADAGPDKVLEFQFKTTLEAASPGRNATGSWSVIAGAGSFSDHKDAGTTVTDLALGKNIFLWTVKNDVCPPSFDSVTITVMDLIVPSLITPNMDKRNDYLVIPMNESLGKTELIIFDRNGSKVFSDTDYKNNWNGIDFNRRPLPEGTYFYLMKFSIGRSVSGFVVIRR